MHPAIKLRHIRSFLDIAADGNLSSVARRQGITQPALSRSLAELETLLGQKLFHRQGRRLILSDAGTLFRRHASLAMQMLETGAAEIAPGAAPARLRVGILPTVAARLFPRVAMRFGELAPETTLSVVTGPQMYLVKLLREGAIDLMIGRMPAASEMADLSFRHLYEEEVVLAARAGHPLRNRLASEVVAAAPVILPPEGAAIRGVVDSYLATIGQSGRKAALETVALALGRGVLLGSDAVWFISAGVIHAELARGDLITLPTGARFLSGAVGITTRQEGTGAPGLDLLVRITQDAARDLA